MKQREYIEIASIILSIHIYKYVITYWFTQSCRWYMCVYTQASKVGVYKLCRRVGRLHGESAEALLVGDVPLHPDEAVLAP